MIQKYKQKYLRLLFIIMILSAAIFYKDATVSAKEVQTEKAAEQQKGEESSTKASKEMRFTENGINYVVNADGSIYDEIQGLTYTYDKKKAAYAVAINGAANVTEVVIADTLKGNKVTKITSLGTDKVVTVKLGKNVTTIAENAFCYRTNLKTVILPDAIKTIEESAFSRSGLTSIVIPKNVSSIGKGAFSECEDLTSVEIKNGKLTTLPENCFYGSTALKEITLPAKVTKLGKSVFSGCSGLEKVVFKGKIKTISDNCFYGTTALKSITLPATVTKIGAYAFYDSGLINITIPSKVSTIGNHAFNGCKSLQSIKLPSALKKIGDNSFGDTGLKELTIPAKVSSIGYSLISDCKSLKTLTLKCNIKELTSSYVSSQTLETLNISGKVNSINGSAFYNAAALKQVNISGTVKTIKSYAFNNCPVLNEVKISGAVTKIDSYAFYGCKNLKKVICSQKVKGVDSKAFYNCNASLTVVAKNFGVYNSLNEGNSVFVTQTEEMGFNLNTGLMHVGENKQIIAYNYPGTLKWKSSDSSVIKITSDGKAVAKKAGSATLTAIGGEQQFTLKMQVLDRTKENIMRIIYAEYVRPELTDYEKVVAANKWLVENVKYDYDNLNQDTIPWESFTANGAFEKGIAVCQGYALAFKEIMDYYEVPCRMVTSNAMNHAWNAVNINGHWYHVDVTWNDPIVSGSNGNTEVRTKYLLVADKEITDHYGYSFQCNTSQKSEVDKYYKTKSATSDKKVTEQSPVVPYLNAVKKSMNVGDKTFTLQVTGTKATKFTSSNKKVATVTAKGVINAKKAGTANIKVMCQNGATYTCKVAVENPKLSKNKLSLNEGKTTSLKVANTKQKVQWSSSNSAVATVTAKGKVKAVSGGTAKITAEVNGKKMTCTVTVHAHSYQANVTKNPTCTTAGKKTYTCSCGKKYTEKIGALGHNYQWIVIKKASKTEAKSVADFGKRELKCEHCNHLMLTEDMINTGTKIIFGYFDDASAGHFFDRINEYRGEEMEEYDYSCFDFIMKSYPEVAKSETLESELKIATIKYIVDYTSNDEWNERIFIEANAVEDDFEDVWKNFPNKSYVFRKEETKEIGTCCFHYDRNGDGEIDTVYWGIFLDEQSGQSSE